MTLRISAWNPCPDGDTLRFDQVDDRYKDANPCGYYSQSKEKATPEHRTEASLPQGQD
ncbi:MAG: hypothetical protein ACKO14_03430 [Armatimonadota bacterium]